MILCFYIHQNVSQGQAYVYSAHYDKKVGGASTDTGGVVKVIMIRLAGVKMSLFCQGWYESDLGLRVRVVPGQLEDSKENHKRRWVKRWM